jgi:hypothetical protein
MGLGAPPSPRPCGRVALTGLKRGLGSVPATTLLSGTFDLLKSDTKEPQAIYACLGFWVVVASNLGFWPGGRGVGGMGLPLGRPM